MTELTATLFLYSHRALLVNASDLCDSMPPGATFSPSLFQTREVPTLGYEEFNPFGFPSA